jgi:hypothetical protein
MQVSEMAKRARTDNAELPGRERLLLVSAELKKRLRQRYCSETELVHLLIVHGFVRRERTIEIEARPLGGDSFKVTLSASNPSVAHAKSEIARVQGTAEEQQELYTVAASLNGNAVREDDAESELLHDDGLLGDGEVVAMAVKEPPILMWRTFPETRVVLSEAGAVATNISNWSLTSSGLQLTEGTHYWEVELLSETVTDIFVGVSRPNLKPTGIYHYPPYLTDGWFIECSDGDLHGNGKERDDAAGEYKQGDRVGVLLDLSDGSLRFFKNGVPHNQGYPAGSVTGPVVHALQMFGGEGRSVRMLPTRRDGPPPS